MPLISLHQIFDDIGESDRRFTISKFIKAMEDFFEDNVTCKLAANGIQWRGMSREEILYECPSQTLDKLERENRVISVRTDEKIVYLEPVCVFLFASL